MRISLRPARRFGVNHGFALAGLLLVAAQGRAASPPEKILPDSTIAVVKLQNGAAFRAGFPRSQLGQLWNDPAFDAWKGELNELRDALSKTLKAKLGATLGEILELPQGPIAIAVLSSEKPRSPLSLVTLADAGNNAAAMNDLLSRATEQAAQAGAKVSTAEFQGVTIHVIQFAEGPAIGWAGQGSVFTISSDVEAIKDLTAHAEGRDDALAASETYIAAVKKLGSDAPVFWFVDLSRIVRLQTEELGHTAGMPRTQELEAMVQRIGLGGLRAITGSFALGAGNLGAINKTMLLLDGPLEGLLKVFHLPAVSLEPEPWVPASVASYQSLSWDLDGAFSAIKEMVNQYQPGLMEILEQQLAGPDGGEPLKLKQDLFDPLGDRFTIISDFKKPVTQDTRRLRLALNLKDPKHVGFTLKEGDSRMLLAVALEDSRTFQNTLNKLIELTGLQPTKREFLGTMIHDFELPDVHPDSWPEKARGIHLGTLSVAIARDTLFISREPTLLEQVLRGGGPTLAESEDYREFARELPDRTSAISYIRPELQARITYDMLIKGEFGTPLLSMAVIGPDSSKVAGWVDADKVPDFSVFTKYPAQAGIYSEATEDGLTITGFSLRKAQP